VSAASNSTQAPSTRRSSTTGRRGSSVAHSTSSYRPSPSASIYDPRLGDGPVQHEDQNGIDHAIAQTSSVHGNRYPSNNVPITRSRLSQQQHSRNTTPGSHHSARELSTLHYGEPSHLNNYRDPITTAVTSAPVDEPGTPEPSDDERYLPDFIERQATPQLKGVQWPGMSLFDSASAVGRRRRNQKKSASVVEQLEANSLEVEPIEKVYDQTGELCKEREISGLPSSSSPIVSPIQHHVKVYRPPLGQIESRHIWANQAGVTRYNSYTDRRLEEALTYGYLDTRKRKRILGVYHDDGKVLTGTFSQPLQMDVLTRRTTRTRTVNRVNGDDDVDDDEPYQPRVRPRKRKSGVEQLPSSRNDVRQRLMNDNVEFDNQGRRSHGNHITQVVQQPISYAEATTLINSRRQNVDPYALQASAIDFNASYPNQQVSQPTQSRQLSGHSQRSTSHNHSSIAIENLLNLNSTMENATITADHTSFGANMVQSHDINQQFDFNPVNTNNLQPSYVPMAPSNTANVNDWNFWNPVGNNAVQHNDLWNNLTFNSQFLNPDLTGQREIGEERSTPSVGDLPVASTFHNHIDRNGSETLNGPNTSVQAETMANNMSINSTTDQRVTGMRDYNEIDEDRTLTATPSRDGF
jgi:hypothetical protein